MTAHHQRGITLLELLIACAISAVVISSIYASFRAGLFGYKNIGETLSTYSLAQNSLDRIETDLRNVIAYSKDKTLFFGSSDSITLFSLVDTFTGTSQERQCALITYELSSNRLMRLCKKAREALKDASQTQPQELAVDASSLRFAYGWRLKNDEPLRFDKDSWNDQRKLPCAVRITLSLGKNDAKDFQRTVYLPAATNE